MTNLDIQKIKKDFPIFESERDLVYLDSTATSQTPESVIRSMDEYYRHFRSNIHRGFYGIAERATDQYERARHISARFLGAENEEIIFTSGSTMASNMLIYSIENSIDLKEGDEIVTSVVEHHASLIPLQELARRKKMVLKFIPIKDDMSLDYEAAEMVIGEKTKIVAFSMASNVLGTIYDAKKLASYANKVGAISIVDATAVAGHMDIKVKDIDCGALYLSGHKMLGPTGIGILYIKSDFGKKLKPSIYGGGIVESVNLTDSEWKEMPSKFEAGTSNVSGAIGLGEAIRFIEELGIDNIKKHVEGLVEYAITTLSKLEGVTIFSEKEPTKNIGIISFNVEGIHSHDLVEIAGRNNVALRGGHHCAMPLIRSLGVLSTARASFYLYNDKSDIDKLVVAIKKAKEIFK